MAQKSRKPNYRRIGFIVCAGVILIKISLFATPVTTNWRETASGLPAHSWAWGASVISWACLIGGAFILMSILALYAHYFAVEQEKISRHHASSRSDVAYDYQAVVDLSQG